MVIRGARAEVVRVTTPGPPSSPESIKLRPLALNLKPKESLNKQLFTGNIHLILAGETVVNSVWS